MSWLCSILTLNRLGKSVRLGLIGCAALLTFPLALLANATSPHHPSQLTPPQIQKILQFLKTTDPAVYEEALTLRQSKPAKFVKLISAAAPNFRRLENLQNSDPKLFSLTIEDLSLTHQSFSLADQLRQPGLTGQQTQHLRARLLKIVSVQFGVRQQIRKLELDRLMRKINELKAQYAQRQKNQAQIIAKRVADLIGKPPSVNW